jgi:peptidoglycan/LPS O-acetylase OafA/YrhL
MDTKRHPVAADRVAYLDGLRATAALMVFITHAAAAGLIPLVSFGPIGYSIITQGVYGVTIFFVVSAYTLCMSVAPALEGRPVSWRAYFIRRFFRIAPLYYAVLVFATYVSPHTPDVTSLFLHVSFLNVFTPQYANDILSVEWTIAVEWGFYIVFPLLVLAARSRVGLAMVIAAAGLLLVVRLKLFDALPAVYSEYRMYSPLFHFYAFVGGLAVYVMVRHPPALPVSRSVLIRCLNLLAVGLVVFAIWRGNSGFSAPLVATVTGIVIFNAEADGLARSILSWRPLAYVGRISFSVYLLHPFFLGWAQHLGWWPFAEMLLALAGLLAAASITYFCIERPGMRAGRLLAQKLTPRALDLRSAAAA